MGVPSVQEDNHHYACESAKPPPSDLMYETNHRDSVQEDNQHYTPEGSKLPSSDLNYEANHRDPVQEDNQIYIPKIPKLPTSDLEYITNYSDKSCVSVDQKHDKSENIGMRTAETTTIQDSAFYGLEQLESIHEDAATNTNPEEVSLAPDGMVKNRCSGELESIQEDAPADLHSVESVFPLDNVANGPEELGPPADDVAKIDGCGQLEPVREDPNSNPEESGPQPNDVLNNLGLGQLERMEEDGTQCTTKSKTEKLKGPPNDVAKNGQLGELVAMEEDATCKKIEDVATDPNPVGAGVPRDDVSKNQNPTDEVANEERGDGVETNSNTEEPGKGNSKLSCSGNPRVLRSRSEEKSKVTESSTNLDESLASKENKRKKKKKKIKNDKKDNEFSRIRNHFRYLLTRMSYEKNLIDAYSGEGWKGQSLEKIKPEKELERAKSEIFRCKLKIRDLFQRIHMSCVEGRLSEDLFDSEGEIESEDIFCAKCGSKELPANNDIILCDGACERGFHQFCLDPPLLTEDIPPGDEGWLCPGCDCKVDCIELLNDSQGTNLCITDGWEEVFPEAAAAASGTNMADISGLPSDDSEDDDYDPEGPQLDEETQYTESSSDESDFTSASEDDLRALNITDPYAGLLPSDDSEDYDYNPNSKDPDKNDEQENSSSSSDFTSDSEYFSAGSENDGERSEVGRAKKKSLSDEVLYLLEAERSGSAPLAEKRHVERLDYKRLHDEQYGNASSDSSDEDYTTNLARKRRKTNNGNVDSPLPKKKGRQKGQVAEKTPDRRTGKKVEDEIAGDSPAKPTKSSSGPDSSGKNTNNRKLGEAATQRLFEIFKENKYPSRVAKENLAKDLSLTLKQVSRWFENARRSFNHSSRMDSKLAESAFRNGTNNGLEKSVAARNSRPSKSRKSQLKSDNKNMEADTRMQNTDDHTPKAQEVRRSGRVRSKSTNSGS